VEAVGGLAKSGTKRVPTRRAQKGDDPPNGIESAALGVEGGGDKRVIVMAIEGAVKWRVWLDRLAGFGRLPSTALIDVAWAKQKGFPESPPKRQMR